jgi:outer membrane lipoprotein LolB
VRAWPGLLLILLVSGCSFTPPRPALDSTQLGPAWQAQQARILANHNWTLTGRLGIKTPEDAWSATLLWTQHAEQFQIRVTAPFGQGSVELQGGPGQVVMRAPKDKTYEADEPEALMHAQLGWSLPLAGLRYWVRGVPDPQHEVTHIRLDNWGRLAELQQSGWRISIEDYQLADGIELPAKMSLLTDRLEVRLVTRDWQLGPG